MKTPNPYPPRITDDSSDEVVPCRGHAIGQVGYDTRNKDYGDLIDKIIDVYKGLESVRRQIEKQLSKERNPK